MADDGNPLGIRDIEGTMYIPLDHLSEEEVERLRAEHLQANTVDSTAEELGDPPPGIKDDADDQARALMEEALENPIGGDGEPASPSDALG